MSSNSETLHLNPRHLLGMLVGAVLVTAVITSALAAMLQSNIFHEANATEEFHFTLIAKLSGFEGEGGDIDGQVNPDLRVSPGSMVTITLKAGESIPHNFNIDEIENATSNGDVSTNSDYGQSEITFSFVAPTSNAVYTYYCAIPGHFATMHGRFIVGNPPLNEPEPAKPVDVESIVRHPTDIPPPVGDRPPQNVTVTIVAKELTSYLEDGTTFTFWTFNGTIPGPLIRVRVNDTVTIRFVNPANNTHVHSIDFHAVNDVGGGKLYTEAKPGETHEFTFVPRWEGVFVYHCASEHIPTHISHGMYGAISVEPAGGLPAVDKEFYVGQHEIYTKWPAHTKGHQEFDDQKQLMEEPTYVVFNGAYNALMDGKYSLNATVNTTVRLFFAVGGPNLISSFHLIGGVWDRVYYEHGWEVNLYNAETIAVVPGSALAIEMDLKKVGTFILVDHALSRAVDKGAIGLLVVSE